MKNSHIIAYSFINRTHAGNFEIQIVATEENVTHLTRRCKIMC